MPVYILVFSVILLTQSHLCALGYESSIPQLNMSLKVLSMDPNLSLLVYSTNVIPCFSGAYQRAGSYFSSEPLTTLKTLGISWINCNCTSDCVGVAQWWGSVRCCSFSSLSQDVPNKMEPAKQHEAKLQVVIQTLHAFFSVILSSCLENSNTLCKTYLPQDIKFWEPATLQTIKTSNHTSPYIIKSQ